MPLASILHTAPLQLPKGAKIPHRTPYSDRIRNLAPNYDPRHVEAYMRDFLGTLDHLSPAQFRAEVRLAAACIEEGGPAVAERAARSFGL